MQPYEISLKAKIQKFNNLSIYLSYNSKQALLLQHNQTIKMTLKQHQQQQQ